MTLEETIFDILLDNEDKFVTVDEIYQEIKENPSLYDANRKTITYKELCDIACEMERKYKNCYTFYKLQDDMCRLVCIYSTKNKYELRDKLYKTEFKLKLVDEYNIFGMQTYVKKFINTIKENKDEYNFYEKYLPKNYWYYCLNLDTKLNENLTITEVEDLENFYKKEKDYESLSKVLEYKLSQYEKLQDTLYQKINNLEEKISVVYDTPYNAIEKKKTFLSMTFFEGLVSFIFLIVAILMAYPSY